MANTENRALLANYITGTQATVSTGRNYVLNSLPFLGVENISVSGATVAKNTTSPLTSMGDFEISLADNATDTIYWSLAEQDEELINQNCEFRFTYRSSSIGDNVVAVVRQDTNVLNQSDPLQATSLPQVVSINVPCTDLSLPITVGFKNDTGNSGASTIYVANLQYGRATNLSEVSQSYFYGSAFTPTTANCQWARNSGAWGNYSIDAQCPVPTLTGNVLAPTTQIPGFRMTNVQPGTYQVLVSTALINPASGNDAWRLSDGTQASGYASGDASDGNAKRTIVGYFTYDTPQSDITIQLQNIHVGGSAGNALIDASVRENKLEFSVYYFPSSTQTVYNANTTPAWGSVYFEGIASCNWTANNTSYTSFSANANCNNPTVKGNATSAGKIPGGTFTNLPAGSYLAIANGQFETGNTAGQSVSFRLYDGTNGVGGVQAYSSSANDFDRLTSVSGVFTYTSFQPSITIQMQALRSGSSSNYMINASGSDISFGITLIPLSQNLPAPQLVGSVFSGTNGKIRTEFVTFGGSTPWGSTCSSSPCTIWSSSGSSTSVTRTSAGIYNVVWASGVWKGNPSCTASVHNDSSGTSGFSVSIPRNLLTTTNTTAYYRASASDVLADTATTISCMESQ